MKNVRPIHLIAPGDTFGKLVFRTKDNVLFFYQHYGAMPDMGDERHHLHFIAMGYVEDGDWYYDTHNNIVLMANENSDHKTYLYPKVVATSDDKLHKEYGIPMISDQNIFEYSCANGEIESLELVTEQKYIEPHESIHSNRGGFIDVLKLNKEGEVIIHIEPPVMVDWNQFPISTLIEHLEDKFKFDSSGTAKAVFELIAKHKQTKEGLEWIKKEYITHVNDSDAIVDKIEELLNDEQVEQ